MNLSSSRVNFTTSYLTSSCLHVLVAGVGNVEDTWLSDITNELDRVPLPNHPGQQLKAKFVLQTTPLLSEWSDLQFYRRHVGLLCVSEVTDSNDVNNVFSQYEKFKKRYEISVFDSRCIIFSTENLMLPPNCLRPDIMVVKYSGEMSSVHGEELTSLIGEFTQALFSVIRRKSIEKGSEKNTHQLLYSPQERSTTGLGDGRAGKKRILGRHKKLLGDLHLITGHLVDAIDTYKDSLEILTGIGDSVWTGAAYEGMCCAITRLTETEGPPPSKPLSPSDKLRSSQDSLNSISSDQEMRSEENIISTWWRALNCYEKVGDAIFVQIESTLKFIRLLIDLKNYKEACSVINEMSYTIHHLTPVEKIQFCCTIAMLYQSMGMERKYCAYLRQAALEAVGDTIPIRAYLLAQTLLCEVIEKYGVKPGDTKRIGWPTLQVTVLNDLLTTSEKLADSQTIVKYGMCLLQNFHRNLPLRDQEGMIKLIASNNSQMGDLRIDVPCLPVCKQILVRPLSDWLSPHPATVSRKEKSVFIHSALKSRVIADKDEESWVCGEFGTVFVRLENPLQHHIVITEIRTVISGGRVDCFPGQITIPPKQCGDIVLTVKPLQTSVLKITGLQLKLCDVPCHIEAVCSTAINVSPAMPLLSLESAATFPLRVYEGEETVVKYTLTNQSPFRIDRLEIEEFNNSPIFSYEPIPLPLEPSSSVEFRVTVDTRLSYTQRMACLADHFETAQPARPGTDYENSSEEEEEEEGQDVTMVANLATRKRSKASLPVVHDGTFSVSVKYYNQDESYYRKNELQFIAEITLLYNLLHYKIEPYHTDSSLFLWTLHLLSIAPVKFDLSVLGSEQTLQPGQTLHSAVSLPRVQHDINPWDVSERVRYRGQLPGECDRLQWNIAGRKGLLYLGESIHGETMLADIIREPITLTCQIQGSEISQSPVCLKVGVPLALTMTVTNTSNSTFGPLLLYTKAFKDCGRSKHSPASMPHIGTRERDIKMLDPGQSSTHQLHFLPLTRGKVSLLVGACVLPAVNKPVPCTTAIVGTMGAERPVSVYSTQEDYLEFGMSRKNIMKKLNEGLGPHPSIEHWVMRPSIHCIIE